MNERIEHLIISPHLDDGVLSLGPMLSKWARDGEKSVVLTIFAGSAGPDLTPADQEDRARYGDLDPIPIRMAEDDAAAEILGFEPIRIELPEVIFRWRPDGTPRCAVMDDVFGDMATGEQGLLNGDEQIMQQVREVISDALADLEPTNTYVPSALGNHIDHQIVRSACEQVVPDPQYYLDVPYAIDHETKPNMPSIEAADIENWIRAVDCYPTQLSNMFGESDWKSRFISWIEQ